MKKKEKEEEMKQLKQEIKRLSENVAEKSEKSKAKSITLEQPVLTQHSNAYPQSIVPQATAGEVEMANFLIKQLGEEACIKWEVQ
mgnify:CR=1 FL=1